MLSIVVLGTAAGGGVPQWNCGCANCRSARNGHPELQSTQASIAVSADREHWFLVNASPDLRQQITETPALHPKAGHLRQSPIAGVILTNGEVDAITGLLSLREGSRPLAQAVPGNGAVTFLSGPEGGLSPAEEASAIASGFSPVTLGPRVLRAETAPLACLSLLTLGAAA